MTSDGGEMMRERSIAHHFPTVTGPTDRSHAAPDDETFLHPTVISGDVPAETLSSMSLRKWLQNLAALGGVAVFFWLVAQSGITLRTLSALYAPSLLLLTAASIGVVLLDTWAWRYALLHLHRAPFARLLGLRVAGDAIMNAVPGGVVLSETFKAVMVKRWLGVSLSDNAAILILVRMMVGLSQASFVVIGLVFLYPDLARRSQALFGFEGAQNLALLATLATTVAMLLTVFAAFRTRALTRLAACLNRGPGPMARLAERITPALEAFEAACHRVVHNNRRHLIPVFILAFAGWVVSALETYAILWGLGHRVSFETAFVIESVGSLFRLIFFIVPSGIGGQDAILLVLSQLYGLPSDVGGAFIVLKRAKELVLIGLGFSLLPWLNGRSIAPQRQGIEVSVKAAESVSGGESDQGEV
jgi:uncharacterized protein (TIRG00374 family)